MDIVIYIKEAKRHLPGLYHFIFWKNYQVEESTWESSSAVIYHRKIISTFHKNNPEKLTGTSLLLNSAPPMAKPLVKSVKLFAKQKHGCLTSSTKWAKEWDIERWDFFFFVLIKLEDFFINSVSIKRDAHLI